MALRDEIIADGEAAWFDTDGLAQIVTYFQPSRNLGEVEVTQEIPAVLTYGDNLGGQGRFLLQEMTALIPRSTIAAPRDGDTLTVAGEVWTVRKIVAGDALGVTWTLGCTRGERATMRRQA
jgi:hypothetical protein